MAYVEAFGLLRRPHLIISIRQVDRYLCKIIGVGARQDLFVVIQILCHGDQVVLYTDIHEALQQRTNTTQTKPASKD
jgi:hypothetical protein